jgi:hypothetical protein
MLVELMSEITPLIALTIMYESKALNQLNEDFTNIGDDHDRSLSTNNCSESLCSEKDDEETTKLCEEKVSVDLESLKLEDISVQ